MVLKNHYVFAEKGIMFLALYVDDIIWLEIT